jgi:hypothetical protein
MSASSKRYMGRVAKVDCVLCTALGTPGVKSSVHHVREGQGIAERAYDRLTVA